MFLKNHQEMNSGKKLRGENGLSHSETINHLLSYLPNKHQGEKCGSWESVDHIMVPNWKRVAETYPDACNVAIVLLEQHFNSPVKYFFNKNAIWSSLSINAQVDQRLDELYAKMQKDVIVLPIRFISIDESRDRLGVGGQFFLDIFSLLILVLFNLRFFHQKKIWLASWGSGVIARPGSLQLRRPLISIREEEISLGVSWPGCFSRKGILIPIVSSF